MQGNESKPCTAFLGVFSTLSYHSRKISFMLTKFEERAESLLFFRVLFSESARSAELD
nr:MAG TPA: hypothetical protein [Caudoviricetes sp.]